MCENETSVFKTPLSFNSQSRNKNTREPSLSQEFGLIFNDPSFQIAYNKWYQLSIQLFDETDKLEDSILTLTEETGKLWSNWKRSKEQYHTLKAALGQKTEESVELERCLKRATQMLNDEKDKRKHYEQETDDYKSALSHILKTIRREGQTNPTSDIQKLLELFYPSRKSLDESLIQNKLMSSVSSADSSYIRFEEELDSSKYLKTGKTWKTLQISTDAGEPMEKATSTKLEYNNLRLSYKRNSTGKKAL